MIVGIVIGVVVSRKKDDPTLAPTPVPIKEVCLPQTKDSQFCVATAGDCGGNESCTCVMYTCQVNSDEIVDCNSCSVCSNDHDVFEFDCTNIASGQSEGCVKPPRQRHLRR